MSILLYKDSQPLSLGVELEYQIINSGTFNLVAQAKALMRSVHETPFEKIISPEITQSMLEINSNVHQNPINLFKELCVIKKMLLNNAQQLDFLICGGGTHPFTKWRERKIFPSKRNKKVYHRYQYMAKRATV